jgi:hypothetical protein
MGGKIDRTPCNQVTRMSYATSQYLIYALWEVMPQTGGTICGSMLIDHATKEDLEEKIKIHKARHSKVVSIQNQAEWWR